VRLPPEICCRAQQLTCEEPQIYLEVEIVHSSSATQKHSFQAFCCFLSQEEVDDELSLYRLNIQETVDLLPAISSGDCRKVNEDYIERLAEDLV
jgi:hypothetical protein